jgi:hypothetical protein
MAAKMTESAIKALLLTIQNRFQQNMQRHQGIDWLKLEQKLRSRADKCKVLYDMEQSGGEPDVVACDKKNDVYVFMDCSIESPKDRRSWCYDRDALDKRKENKPLNDAISALKSIGAEILSEEDYRYLQTLGKFDLKTSSWILTPPAIRKLGGALFCDRRYDMVFTYHNGAESYYAARGVRGKVQI